MEDLTISVLRALIDCVDGDTLDTVKFQKLYPVQKVIEKNLIDLAHNGYIVIDQSSEGIEEIVETPKLIKLARSK